MSQPAISLDIASPFEDLYYPNRYKMYWGGRAATKSWSFADALVLIGTGNVPGYSGSKKILCGREIQKSIKESVYSLLVNRIEALNLGAFYSVTDNGIKGLNGTQFFFEGLWRNIKSIKSIEDVDIAWIEEADAVSDNSWKILIPTIRKPGSEIWGSFNLESVTDPVYVRFVLNTPKNSVVKKVSWRDNPWLSKEAEDERDHLKSVDYDEYLHVWEGEPRRIAKGAIFGKQLILAHEENRITNLPHAQGVEVNTFWDLGRNDLMCIWFHQRIGHENRFIDYYENRLEDLPHYAKYCKDKPYVYGKHYLPHDGEVIMLGTSDDDNPKGKSRKKILEDLGMSPIEIVARIPNLSEGIEQTKLFFNSCSFDESRCARGLECLSQYQYKYSETDGAWTNNVGPKWATNGADAFRQAAQGYNPPVKVKKLRFSSEW